MLARDDEEAIEVALEHGELILRVVASDALARLEYFEAALAHELPHGVIRGRRGVGQ